MTDRPGRQRRQPEQPILSWLRENVSRDDGCGRTVDFIDAELSLFPPFRRNDLQRRLVDKRDTQFHGAAFELIAHRALRRGFPTATVGFPDGGGSVPDFSLNVEGRTLAVVDATLYQDPAFIDDNPSSYGESHLLAAAPKMTHRQYCVRIVDANRSSGTPSPARLAKILDHAIASFEALGTDHVRAPLPLDSIGFQNPEDANVIHVEEPSGWHWELELYPRANNTWPFVVASKTVAGWSRSADALTQRIRDKRRQHRNHDTALLLVVGSGDWMGNDDAEDMEDVLRDNPPKDLGGIITVNPSFAWSLDRWTATLWPLADSFSSLPWQLRTGTIVDGDARTAGPGVIYP